MTNVTLWLIGAALLSQTVRHDAAEPFYSQVYQIIIKGERVGIENVTERRDKKGNVISSSTSEIFISDGLETKRMAFSTEMVLSKNELVPMRYSYNYTSGESRDGYEVTVQDGQIRRVLNRGGRFSEVSVPLQAGVIILDFNVYHQYDLLIRKYDFKKGGRQSFHNFIPLIGGEVPLALTQLQDSTLDSEKGSIPVRNFKIEFVGIWTGTVSAGKDGRLVRLLVREQDLQVIRKDLIAEANQTAEPKIAPPNGPPLNPSKPKI